MPCHGHQQPRRRPAARESRELGIVDDASGLFQRLSPEAWQPGDRFCVGRVCPATVTSNLVADPLLVNPVSSESSTTHQGYSNDYHLKPGSPAIDFASVVYAL